MRKKILSSVGGLIIASGICVSAANADYRHSDSYSRYHYGDRRNTHVGQVDTDGILSPGEIPNRNIDYRRHYDYPDRNRYWYRNDDHSKRYWYDRYESRRDYDRDSYYGRYRRF